MPTSETATGVSPLTEGHASLDARTLLFCIGAQKCGTTRLLDYFQTHPDIHTPPLKQVHHFDFAFSSRGGSRNQAKITARKRADIDRRVDGARQRLEDKSANWPAEKVAEAKEALRVLELRQGLRHGSLPYVDVLTDGLGDEPVVCDASSSYGMLGAKAFAAMRATHTRTKFIFIMRDPVDRQWGAFRAALRTKLSNAAKDFDPDAFLSSYIADTPRLIASDYKGTIEALRKSVPPTDVLCLFYETLFLPETLRAITDFIGVQECPAESFRPKGLADGGSPPPAQFTKVFRARLDPVYAFVARRFGAHAPLVWDWTPRQMDIIEKAKNAPNI
ncbi:sulfotransferase [Shimia sp. Alg240-R146]|uniref:sulfotransferase n=1 Tax=Shimia sp. Alg240-R146 TaxID=2993449 RepID=UPI0022E87BDC|nr:sulfotransferase [Shimia sp. Alg240-R146]